MHMFETFDSSWQRTVEHQDRLLRSADWRHGLRADARATGRTGWRHNFGVRRSE